MKLKKIFLITIFILSLVSTPNYGETLSLYSVSGSTNNNIDSIINPIKSSYNCESIELENLNGDNVITNEFTIDANLSTDKTTMNFYSNIDAFLAILLYNTENDHLTSYEYGSFNENNKFLGSKYNELTNARIKEEKGFSTLYSSKDLIDLNYEIDKVYVLYSTADVEDSTPTESVSPIETDSPVETTEIKAVESESVEPNSSTTSSNKFKNNIVLILVIAVAFIIFIILIAILLIIYFISKRNN